MTGTKEQDLTPLSSLTNRQLACRAQSKSMPAFTELVTRFEKRLFNFLLRRVQCPADAEDITQESFVRAWQSIERYDPTWEFSTWLFTIGRRLAANQIAKNKRAPKALGPAIEPSHTDDPAKIAADIEQQRGLWDLVQIALNTDQQTALWLRYGESMPVQDIAKVLGRTSVSVRVMLFRARQTLAEKLNETSGQLPQQMPDVSLPQSTRTLHAVTGGVS